MDFLIATHNMKKRAELERILKPIGVRVLLAEEVGVELTDVEETGVTFEENAFLKADSGCKESGMPCIADDSGLAVDALDGAPGVYSARFAGEGHDDAANRAKLFAELRDVPAERRTAHFACAMVLVRPGEPNIEVVGRVDGRILFEERGENGFGYDNMFLYEPFGLSFAEIDAERKNGVSHRRRALELVLDALKKQ